LQTEIGRNLRDGRARIATGVGLAAVIIDLWMVWWNRYPESIDGRWAMALVVLASHIGFTDGNLSSVGLCAPSGGWRHWIRLSALLGLIAVGSMGVLAGVWMTSGWRLPVQSVAPTEVVPAFLRMCVFAPLLEETIYRVALCMPLVPVMGPRWSIAISGVTFGLLHVVYGNASPENLLGGFILAWAYLRSGSLYMPILLHAGGNLLILVGQVGVWYYTIVPN
jgi:membrane protease YdiL (CAAX protease family)